MDLDVFLKAFHNEHSLKFVETCNEIVDANDIKFVDIIVPRDIATVLYWRLKNHANNWLLKPVPALNFERPIDLLKSDDGKK
ncbi:antitoxin Xre/MbcA/ParS toxin-binding domain-containing protein [Paenibacillus sp. Root444D2]|uniref:antitoxin Xre/MbcA/ParS toxin-binding domain-containing protein n=1 Tax=Paenibacillus sp. Root444D2 TaxID=1736538 RepID=UPI0007107388|nr:antitoxin Xre/MbcA/ParS toxin-binding domain-containing protein [Paenibacillus sp. Root444D2]KQX51394.1 hypothetical protein ASD40_35480 [Paenibacillus sp. Root444D2]